jgi:hypothetical protein
MQADLEYSRTVSLAELRPGGEAVITRFLFDRVADYCGGLGLIPGTAVRRRPATRALLVDLDDRRTVIVDPDRARYVTVALVPSSEAGAPSRRAAPGRQH